MFSSILVRNLGPLRNVSLDLSADFSVIIGPQASGKSTFGKIIYFCKKIRDYAIDFIGEEEMFFSSSIDEMYDAFLRKLIDKFRKTFDPSEHISRDFFVKYYYNEGDFVELTADEKKYIQIHFSDNIERILRDLFKSMIKLNNDQIQKNGDEWNKVAFSQFWNYQGAVQSKMRWANNIFHNDAEIIYIPAGRGIFSILATQFGSISNFALPITDFIERVKIIKERFRKSLDKVVNDYSKTDREPVNKDDLKLAQDIIRKILKADYVNDTDGEKLYFDSNNWVRLIYGSSGQQEALWILLLMFSLILEHKKAFVILEEPEANVYPNAQLDIIKLIALTLNSTQSQFFITTHSPYIMTSANLLIHSGQVENNISENEEGECNTSRFKTC